MDMLTSMGISADGIVGHSVGELGCAYADGSLTARETILAAYWRGYCIQTAKLPPGGMAAVGKYNNQGSHKLWKSWKTWKILKNVPCMEKS